MRRVSLRANLLGLLIEVGVAQVEAVAGILGQPDKDCDNEREFSERIA